MCLQIVTLAHANVMQAKAAASALAPALDKARQEHEIEEARLQNAHKRKLEETETKDKTEMVSMMKIIVQKMLAEK